MQHSVLMRSEFRGVDANDPFVRAALSQSPVVTKLGPIAWPDGLEPVAVPLGGYTPGVPITTAVSAAVDVLVLLYTELETSALLDVFTGDNSWTPERQKTWYPYAHNFAELKNTIEGIAGDTALEHGEFGYLYAMTVGKTNVVFFKSELHPKANGTKLPFVAVIAQLVAELKPGLVITTGTAGGIGPNVNCGDVTVCSAARFHVRDTYPTYPAINTLSSHATALTNQVTLPTTYLRYAAEHFTALSLPGLKTCFERFAGDATYEFLRAPSAAPKIFGGGLSAVNGPEPMDVVSADYLTVDDASDAEGLQALGIMNETDDAFAIYAIEQISGTKPKWLSVRNASEPQIVAKPFPAGTDQTTIVDTLKGIAGAIYGVYQYCTTQSSAFAVWGIAADFKNR